MALTNQTYNIQDKHKKPPKLNLTKQTNPGLVASYNSWLGNGSGLF